MKVLNQRAYEWRRDHREEVLAQLKTYLEKVGRRAPPGAGSRLLEPNLNLHM